MKDIHISKAEFEKDYLSMTNAQVVEKYGLRYDADIHTIRKIAGIPRKNRTKAVNFIIGE